MRAGHFVDCATLTRRMRVLGIDCGSEFTGFGVVELENSSRHTKLVPIVSGAIRLQRREAMPQRLAQIYAELTALMELHRPDVYQQRSLNFSGD